VGLAEDRRRALDAWNKRCQVNGRKVSSQASRTPITYVENIPRPTCSSSRIDGILHRPDGCVSGVVRFHRACPRSTANCSLQCDRTSYGAVDGATARRSVSFWHYAKLLGSIWRRYIAVRTLHRELFDHVILLNARHVKRLVSSYLDYYHPWRTHQSLDRDAPNGRPVRTAEPCNVVEFPAVHGFHHAYLPKAA